VIEKLVETNITGNKISTDLFEADKYQIYVSASTVVYNKTCVFATIPSGQGKTIMMLLNALYELLHNKRKSVCFVTCNEVLSNQLKRDIVAIVPKLAEKLFFGHTDKPETIAKSHEVMIVDEADMCMEKMITFNQTTGDLNGMFYLTGAHKVYFFSATMSDYYKELASQVIGAYDSQDFKSQY
jgi:hypothetical protein